MASAPHLTVATVVERHGRFLLVEERVGDRLVYNQPAGHVEGDETLPTAAVRETLEETGWTVAPQAVIGIYQWRHPASGVTFVRVCFAAACLRHHPDRALDEEIVRTVWLSREEVAAALARLRSPMVLRCIDDYLVGHRHSLGLLTRL